MPYKKGDVLKNGNNRYKILLALDGVYLTSSYWTLASSSEESSRMTGSWLTEYELEEGGWSLCPPDQTLLPAEKWVPKKGDSVFNGMINEEGKAISEKMTWGDFRLSYQNGLLAIGNVHKTSEEAIEWACKRYGITKP